ncbi:MAG: hypothetical protein ACRCVK_19630, partial [Aeromonas veronii]
MCDFIWNCNLSPSPEVSGSRLFPCLSPLEEKSAGLTCLIEEHNNMKKWLVCLLGLMALTAQAAEGRQPFSRV